MNILRNMLAGIRSWFDRRRGVVRSLVPISGCGRTDYFPPYARRGAPGDARSRWSDIPTEMDAVQQAFAQNQSDAEFVHFRRLDENGTIPRQSERWEFEDNGMHRVGDRTYAILAANEAALPAQICGFCGHCHRPILASAQGRCQFCGVLLCAKHARLQQTPSGALVACPACLKNIRDDFDTWAAAENMGSPVSLPCDQSIAALNTQSEVIREQT